MGETEVPAEGVRESEAEAVMAGHPDGGLTDEPLAGEGDTSEPVTEAVPEASNEHSLVGERIVSEEGIFITEAEPADSSEKPEN